MTPFEHFFATDFQRRLDATPKEIGSWDRRAAWLLWNAEGGATPPKPAPPDQIDLEEAIAAVSTDPFADMLG